MAEQDRPVRIVPKLSHTLEDVRVHYDALDLPYREIWGEHVHHGYWRTGRESPKEAVEALVELVGERLRLSPGQEICDIGCGYGATGVQLASRHGALVTGITLSPAQALIARARIPGSGAWTSLLGDWLDNGMADASFDGAYAIESSEHMPDPQAFFTQAARVLRPGGRLVICAWLARSGARGFEIRHLLEPICREGRLSGLGTAAEYEAMAQRAGLHALGFEDISSKVRRTWTICVRRLFAKLLTRGDYRRMLTDRDNPNRIFALTMLRLVVALRTGAMRYGIFVWEKPANAL